MSDVDKIIEYFQGLAAEAKEVFDSDMDNGDLYSAESALVDYNWYRHTATIIKGRFWEE